MSAVTMIIIITEDAVRNLLQGNNSRNSLTDDLSSNPDVRVLYLSRSGDKKIGLSRPGDVGDHLEMSLPDTAFAEPRYQHNTVYFPSL